MPSAPPARARLRALATTAVAALTLALAPTASLATTTTGAAPAAVDPALAAATADGARADAWLVFDETADLAAASRIEDWTSRGQAVVDALKATAAASQAEAVKGLQADGLAHRTFWVSNRVLVEDVDSALTARLAALPNVSRVTATTELTLEQPTAGTQEAVVDAVEWGIAAINADDVWSSYGSRGEGLVIANIDSGVQFDHPALVDRYRGNDGDGTFTHDYNWFDPGAYCSDDGSLPCDNNGHGTHTMGTMVGEDGANQIGVAPAATWIAAKGCGTSSCSDADLLASGEWTIEPTDTAGENPDVSRRPHIVNNSWGGANGAAIDPWYDDIVQAWTAAGQFGVFSNGNSGPGCDTAGSPADGPYSYGVGNFQSNGAINAGSSRGPGAGGDIRPAISAPGTNVRSAVPDDAYASYTGTSMAAPHVAGSVALLWSLAPALMGDVDSTRALLDSTAVDVSDLTCGGTAGDNNVWGEGKLDVLAAAQQAPVGDTGTLAGEVTDAASGEPVAGASVEVTGPVDRALTTDAAGAFSALLPVGTYDVEVQAFGYAADSTTAEVTVDATTEVVVALDAAPQHAVTGSVVDARGAPVEGAQVTLEPSPLEPAVTDAEGGFAFPEVPEGEYTVAVDPAGACSGGDSEVVVVDGDETVQLELTDVVDAYGYYCYTRDSVYTEVTNRLALTGDEASATVPLPFPVVFYGQEYSTAYVSTNGHVNLLAPATAYSNVAIPAAGVPNAAVYAFWDDLNVDAQAAVYTGTATLDGRQAFVVEWRNVKFFGTGTERFDAEAMLFADGSVVTAYRNLDESIPREAGSSATVGIENETGTVATVFSHNTAALSDEFSVVFALPPSGVVTGTVTDANDDLPVSGASVTLTDAAGEVVRQSSTDAVGDYTVQAPAGTYTLTVTKTNYVTQEREVVLEQDDRVTEDFALATARGSVDPTSLEWLLPQGAQRTADLTLTNDGSAPMTFEVAETGGGAVDGAPAELSSYQRAAVDEHALSREVALTERQRSEAVVQAPGDVLTSWEAEGLTTAWGVGVGESGTVWVSDVESAPTKDVEFEADGTATGRSHETPWAGTWPGDMSRDTQRGVVCQVAVGGDNGIHCWDEESGEVSYSLTGTEWSSVSQRGLAYVPEDDTFYVGGWNSEEIFHVAGESHPTPGAVLDSCVPDETGIAGLGWNSVAGALWMASSSATNTVYRLDPATCDTVSSFTVPGEDEFALGGLEVDAAGNLWTASLLTNTVYSIDSGVPSYTDVPWLSVEPTEGEVAVGASTTLEVTVDTTGVEAGVYRANVVIATNSGRQPTITVPVEVVVSGYWTAVNAGGGAYTDSDGYPWVPDQEHSAGSFGWVGTSTDVSTPRATTPINGTVDDPLYRDQREGMDAYRFDALPAGTYEVTMEFAELKNRAVPDWRMFDVSVNGDWALVRHDVADEVGLFTADSHTYVVEVPEGGSVDVQFWDRRSYKAPIVNAISVVQRPDM